MYHNIAHEHDCLKNLTRTAQQALHTHHQSANNLKPLQVHPTQKLGHSLRAVVHLWCHYVIFPSFHRYTFKTIHTSTTIMCQHTHTHISHSHRVACLLCVKGKFTHKQIDGLSWSWSIWFVFDVPSHKYIYINIYQVVASTYECAITKANLPSHTTNCKQTRTILIQKINRTTVVITSNDRGWRYNNLVCVRVFVVVFDKTSLKSINGMMIMVIDDETSPVYG